MPSTAQGGVLGAVTTFGDYINTRIKNIDIFDEHYQNEAKTNPFYALGPIFYLVWFIVIVSGLLLIIWYVPTKPAAFDSILRIQNDIPFGGIIRGMHKYGADAMIIAATMRMYRMFLMGDYKPGKEFNIAIGLVALLLSMYSGLTGYLLIWNQRAFWATKVFATFPTYMDQFPVMGDFYQPLVKSLHMGWNTAEVLLGGGAAITQETITRFFSLHLAFSLIPLILVELYFYKNAYKRVPLNWTKRTIITLMLVVIAIILPAAQGRRSNPDVTPLPILSDWYFLGLYQMYKYLEPVVATEITMVIPISVMLIPFLDTWITGPEKDIQKRPFVFMLTMMGFLCWIIFSYLIIINVANIHNDPPYWRDFLYLMIDVGILWQLALMFADTDIKQKAQQAKGALTMAVIAGIQTILAITYYFMARTEIFMDPIMHSYVYWLLRPFGAENLEKAEGLVRQLLAAGANNNKEYWNFHELLAGPVIAKMGEPAGKAQLEQLAQVCQQPTPLDPIFKAIPTYEFPPVHAYHRVYDGMIDYLVNNRWCFDYVTFCDKFNGAGTYKATYPMNVPDLDWLWMLGGAITFVACVVGFIKFRSAKPAPAAPVKQPAAASTT